MTQPDLVWSTERPTESGDYWLSVHPDKRGSEWDSVEYVRFTVCEDGSCFVQRVRHNAIFDRQTVTDALFNGAKWAEHSLPFNPFEDIHTNPPQHQTGTKLAGMEATGARLPRDDTYAKRRTFTTDANASHATPAS